jgi:hypothetical protein
MLEMVGRNTLLQFIKRPIQVMGVVCTDWLITADEGAKPDVFRENLGC